MRRKKRGKKPSSNARARLSQSWWRHHFVVHPKHLDSLASVPKKREPQTKKKKWHRNPPRGDASAPTLGDHHRIVLFVGRPLSPKSFPRSEIAVASTPTSRICPRRPIFFFRSRHHKRKRPNKTNLRAANRRPRRFATGARTSETRGPRPFASLLFFAPQKNVPFFSSSSSSSSSSAAAATLWRWVLNAFCVALQMRTVFSRGRRKR